MTTETDRINDLPADTISFGPFRLLPRQGLLLEHHTPVQLGSRALDILIALLERPGELVSKEELLARVWPNTFVEPGNLPVHIAALRRILKDGREGNRYIVNIPGRGYRFVAPILFEADSEIDLPTAAPRRRHNLPMHLKAPIGRDDIITEITEQLPRRRLITITGTGGIGKTTVGLAVADKLIEAYEHGVWFVDLASLDHTNSVADAIADALQLEITAGAIDALAVALKDMQTLLVLDNCEHVIASAAAVVARLLRTAPGVHILATSREPLCVEGERLLRLPPLACPPPAADIGAEEALDYPAVQLFVEHAATMMGEFRLADRDAPVVVELCRKLDGLALAIELAAARASVIGVSRLAACLENGPHVLSGGRRRPLPRQQSIVSTLDWSYVLLSETEQKALCRLSAFAGGFTLAAAAVVAGHGIATEYQMMDIVASLAAKSLVMSNKCACDPRFWLLETTRAYAHSKLVASGEVEETRRRHAEYYRAMLEESEPDASDSRHSLASGAAEIDNIREALKWAFAPGGDPAVGTALAIAAAPVWLKLSLLDEFRGWTSKAVSGLAADGEIQTHAPLAFDRA